MLGLDFESGLVIKPFHHILVGRLLLLILKWEEAAGLIGVSLIHLDQVVSPLYLTLSGKTNIIKMNILPKFSG